MYATVRAYSFELPNMYATVGIYSFEIPNMYATVEAYSFELPNMYAAVRAYSFGVPNMYAAVEAYSFELPNMYAAVRAYSFELSNMYAPTSEVHFTLVNWTHAKKQAPPSIGEAYDETWNRLFDYSSNFTRMRNTLPGASAQASRACWASSGWMMPLMKGSICICVWCI